MGVVLFGASAFAASVDTVQFMVLDSEEEALAGVPVELYDSEGNYVNYGTSNESGYVNYFSVEEGEYELRVRPGDAWECSSCTIYESQNIDVTVDLDEAVVDEFIGTVLSLDDVQLEQGDTILTITVTDQNDDPADEVWISGWAENLSGDGSEEEGSLESSWFSAQTDSSGVAMVALSPGIWSVNTWSEEFSDAYENGIVISEGDNEVELTVRSYDATIVASLENEDGSDYTLGEEQWGSISCYNDDWTVYAWGDVMPGESSTSISAVGDQTYTCSFWTEGAGATPASVTVEEDGTAEATIVILSYDAPVEISLVAEGTTDVLSDISSFDYYAYSVLDANGNEYWDDYHWGFGEDGESGEFNVLDGVTYETGAYIVNNSGEEDFEEVSFSGMGVRATAEGSQYVQNYDMQQFVGNSDETTEVLIELAEADATIEVTVSNTEGAWVHAEEVLEDGWGMFVGDDTGFDGTATLAVQSGKTYEIFAYPYDAWDGNKMPPASVEVTPEEGETVEVEMAALEVDHTINISIEIDETDAQAFNITEDFGDFVWCYAYGESTENMVDIFGGEGQLGWLSDSQAFIGCMGYSGETFLRTEGETLVQTGEADGSTDVTLTLGEFGEWYEEESYTFDGSTTTEIELPDESIMTIPAVVEDGNVTLTAESASSMNGSDDNYPVEGWNYELTDSEGNAIEEFNTNITIRMNYDEELLDEIGVSEESLTVKSQGDNNQWTNAASFELDEENNTVTVSVNHFSTWAVVGDKNQSGVPTTKEELEGVSSLERSENQTVTVNYENGDSRTIKVFDKGTAKAKAQLHTNGDVLIAINKRYMRTFDVYSGTQIDQVKLFKNKQAATKFKRLNVYKKKAGQNNVMVLARTKAKHKKKYKLRSYVVKNGGAIVRRNVQAITLDTPVKKFKNLGVKKNKKNGLNARVLVTKKGKQIYGQSYKVTKKKGRLVVAQ